MKEAAAMSTYDGVKFLTILRKPRLPSPWFWAGLAIPAKSGFIVTLFWLTIKRPSELLLSWPRSVVAGCFLASSLRKGGTEPLWSFVEMSSQVPFSSSISANYFLVLFRLGVKIWDNGAWIRKKAEFSSLVDCNGATKREVLFMFLEARGRPDYRCLAIASLCSICTVSQHDTIVVERALVISLSHGWAMQKRAVLHTCIALHFFQLSKTSTFWASPFPDLHARVLDWPTHQ